MLLRVCVCVTPPSVIITVMVLAGAAELAIRSAMPATAAIRRDLFRSMEKYPLCMGTMSAISQVEINVVFP